jgi:TRAP-type C4-dicarboxylate transport system permease small subunit
MSGDSVMAWYEHVGRFFRLYRNHHIYGTCFASYCQTARAFAKNVVRVLYLTLCGVIQSFGYNVAASSSSVSNSIQRLSSWKLFLMNNRTQVDFECLLIRFVVTESSRLRTKASSWWPSFWPPLHMVVLFTNKISC